MEFQTQTVAVTGASRGIGEAAAREFAAAGANVVLMARSEDRIKDIAADIGANALAIPCDVADWASVKAAVDQTVDAFGGINVLINNAGLLEPITQLATADPEAWGTVIDVNLKGVFYGMRAAAPIMAANGGGSILTISSGAAHGPMEGWSQYCSSKAGAAMLTRCLDTEMRDQGIRAMGLSPGTVATEMQRDIKASGINPVSALAWEDHIPPEWPARTLMWMATSDADGWIGDEISLRDEAIRARVGLVP